MAVMAAIKTAKKKTAPTRESAKRDLAPVFAALRQILEKVDDELAVQTDRRGNFHLEIPSIVHRGKPLYFAGIRTGKNYVSFYLMSVYYTPALLKSMSPALKKRMQGKACFNFSSVDPECFAELKRLAAEGVKKFKSEEFRQSIQRMQ